MCLNWISFSYSRDYTNNNNLELKMPSGSLTPISLKPKLKIFLSRVEFEPVASAPTKLWQLYT